MQIKENMAGLVHYEEFIWIEDWVEAELLPRMTRDISQVTCSYCKETFDSVYPD